MKSVLFVDFEASALRQGFPIEIGWAFVDGGIIRAKSLLIQPHKDWDQLYWDDNTESLHGLSRDDLEANGLPVEEVAAAYAEASRGRGIMFDTGPTSIDLGWHNQLLKAAKWPAKLVIANEETEGFLAFQACVLGLNVLDFGRLRKHAPAMTHEAADDAIHWAWMELGMVKLKEAGLLGIASHNDRAKEFDRLIQSIEIDAPGTINRRRKRSIQGLR